MLKYNFERLFKMKGILKPAQFLIHAGFSKDAAYRIVNGKVSAFTPAQIEKLCLIFHCSPNDMMEWIPEDKVTINENHPLKKLIASKEIDLRNIAKDIPINKIEDFAQKLEELKKSLF